MAEYLTTQELAELLRIKQRKVYDMAAKGQIPCSRAMGKLLFPRAEVLAWVAAGGEMMDDTVGAAALRLSPPRPPVFLGSDDPLLDWALRESRCGLATFFDGSADGLNRFERYEGVATGLHIFDGGKTKNAKGDTTQDDTTWNVGAVRTRFGHAPVALVEFAKRDRGLMVMPERADGIKCVADLEGRLIVPRQAGAGSQSLLEHLLAEAGLGPMQYVMANPVLTETDAAEIIAKRLGEVALGLKPAADQHGLVFVPLMQERFDLLIDRRAWFEPAMQTFINFCRSGELAEKAAALGGYDVAGFGAVHFNGGA